MNEIERREFITDQFMEKFGSEPELWSRAPGRVDLMGSHTDYNMGFVMTMTIDRDTWLAIRPRWDGYVHVASANLPGESRFKLDERIEHDREVTWSNYVRGMAHVLLEAGYKLVGFDGFVHSTIPFGSGLSSSAALEMATAVAFQLAGEFELDPVAMALLGQKAENEFVGVSTGILDQYSSVFGRAGCALLLDCRHLTSKQIHLADGQRVVICDTRAERNLVGSEYDERRAQCEEGVRILQEQDPAVTALRDVSLAEYERYKADLPAVVAKRCQFIIEENQRVLDLAEVLPEGDPEELANLFTASYEGARDLYEIGAPAMELMIRAMNRGPGVIAARQAGAGFGGCMVALVQEERVAAFADAVRQIYLAASGIEGRIYAVEAVAGAGGLKGASQLPGTTRRN